MEVCTIDIQDAGFVVLLHSAGPVEHQELYLKPEIHHQKWVQPVGNLLLIPSTKWSQGNILLLFSAWWNRNYSWKLYTFFFLSLKVKRRADWQLRIERGLPWICRQELVCNASVVNWLLSSRQSPTVAGIAANVWTAYSCSHSRTVHSTESKMSPQHRLVVSITSWGWAFKPDVWTSMGITCICCL